MDKDNNAIFTDAKGDNWHIHITFGDIMRVKRHVKGTDGKPLDLCFIAETGDFRQVTDHVEVIVQCAFWLLYDSICEYTGLVGMDAMEEFYSRIDGETIISIGKAWFEALVNFTPSLVVKAAMITAWDMTTKNQVQTAIDILVGQLQTYMDSQELSDSTHETTLMGNWQRWQTVV